MPVLYGVSVPGVTPCMLLLMRDFRLLCFFFEVKEEMNVRSGLGTRCRVMGEVPSIKSLNPKGQPE